MISSTISALDDAPDSAAERRAAGLSRTAYMAIRSRLDFRPALAPTIAMIAFSLCTLGAACALLRQGGAGAFILSQCLIAIFFFNNFSILHECGHGTASRWPLFNAVLGHCASTFCFIPYHPWKYIHQKHHVWAGHLDRDPTLASLRKFRDRGAPPLVRLAWWSWIPITALLQHAVYLTYPYVMWRSGELTRPKLGRIVLSLLWVPASCGALWLAFPELVRPSNLILAFAIFLFIEELVNLPHHVGMPVFERRLAPWEQHRTTRSCHYPRGVSELIVLNFNFHIEHHLFPSLPWYRLRRARELVRAALGDGYTECAGISWNLRNRTRDLDAIIARYRTLRGSETL